MHPPINVYDRDVTIAELEEAAKVLETFALREHNSRALHRGGGDTVVFTALHLRQAATRKRLKAKEEEKDAQFFPTWARAWQEFLEEEETKKTMLTMGLDDIVRIMSAHYDTFYAAYYAEEKGTKGNGKG